MMCECWEITIVIGAKRKANIFISEKLSLECVLGKVTGDKTHFLHSSLQIKWTHTDMTIWEMFSNLSTFYSLMIKRELLMLGFSCKEKKC